MFCFPSFRVKYLYKLFAFFVSSLPFSNLLNHLFISVWTQWVFLHTLGCNRILLYFVAHVLALAIEAFSSGSSDVPPSMWACLVDFSSFLLLELQEAPGASSVSNP